jgi:hypothetical protein
MAFAQTECRDQAIDGLSDCPTLSAQHPVVLRRRPSELCPRGLKDLELQEPFNRRRRSLVSQAVKHLAQDQVSDPKWLTAELNIEPVGSA